MLGLSVRVEDGAEEKKSFKDIYLSTSLLKIQQEAEQVRGGSRDDH